MFAIDLNFQGLALKKPGTKMKLNLNYRRQKAKLEVLGGGLDFRKRQGLNQKIKGFHVNTFEHVWIVG